MNISLTKKEVAIIAVAVASLCLSIAMHFLNEEVSGSVQ